MINKNNLFINKEFKNKKEAMQFVGDFFIDNGNVLPNYLNSIFKRDKKDSVNIGSLLAIPHGVEGSDKYVIKPNVVAIHLKTPLLWDGSEVRFVIGLALKGDSQIEALSHLACNFMDEEKIHKIIDNPTNENMMSLFDE